MTIEKPKQTSTEEVEKPISYTDHYYQKGHWWLKIRQTIVIILLWLCVVIPLYWTLSSTILAQKPHIYHAWRYAEGRDLFYFYDLFFLIAFIILAIIIVGATLHNNHRMKQHVRKEVQYDPEQLRVRKAKLETFYTDRFGQASFRKSVRRYTVNPDQNLETHTIQKLYED